MLYKSWSFDSIDRARRQFKNELMTLRFAINSEKKKKRKAVRLHLKLRQLTNDSRTIETLALGVYTQPSALKAQYSLAFCNLWATLAIEFPKLPPIDAMVNNDGLKVRTLGRRYLGNMATVNTDGSDSLDRLRRTGRT